jgi:hypothetical protein
MTWPQYYVVSNLERPAKIVWTQEEGLRVLAFNLDTGEFEPNAIALSALLFGRNESEQVTEQEFNEYVAKLRELLHLNTPRYYVMGKFPTRALPVPGHPPDVRKYNIETDEFEVVLMYYHLVTVQHGEVKQVSRDEFERCLEELGAWYRRLQPPRYYLVNGRPIKMERADSGQVRLFGYVSASDRFAHSYWEWKRLIPPINFKRVVQVSESEFHQRVEQDRETYQRWRQRSQESQDYE